MENLTLRDGSKIAIIGGGPAGSFFAYFAQKFALEQGIRISTTIFDGKDFLQKGPRGCNLCAGVIANSLVQKLSQEGISFPEKRIINRVNGYCLHIENESLLLTCEENEKSSIATVFRGNGPRYSTFPDIISFDDFLVTLAQDFETEVIREPVWALKLPEDKFLPVRLSYGQRDNPKEYKADMVVGAFGLNSYLANVIQKLGFGYAPPPTLISYQSEHKVERKELSSNFIDLIHVYMPKSNLLRYATIIPKGDFITISLIGKKDADANLFPDFISHANIQDVLTDMSPMCICYPKIAISPSKRPFTDRLVMIGDAGFSRHYKNGIESAFISARLAAETALFYGIDAASFAKHYYKPAKKIVIRDNLYGRLLFSINNTLLALPFLRKSHLYLAKKMDPAGPSKKIRVILWSMFTGAIPYKKIFLMALDFRLQLSLLFNTMRLFLRRLIQGKN